MLRNPSKLLKNQWKLLTSSQSFLGSVTQGPAVPCSYTPRTFSSFSSFATFSPRYDSSHHQQQSGSSQSQQSSSESSLPFIGILPFAMLFFIDHLMNKKAKNCGIVGKKFSSSFLPSPVVRCGWIRKCQRVPSRRIDNLKESRI
jgi:hypothetical protein